MAATLTQLARRYRMVAVVSGRPAAYLLDALAGAEGVVLCGLYGLEKASGGAVQALPEAERWRPVVDEVASAAGAEVPAGVYVERKGLALALHVRTAPEQAGWVEEWARRQAARTGLVAHPAKMAVELLPPVPSDKGSVVSSLAAGLDAVCYLGDDWGDLPAFDALARLAAAGVATLAVAVRSAESPPELLERADLVVDGPAGALALLRRLAAG